MVPQELYLALGSLAAHAQGGGDGFRQREVRFFSELFSNWVNVGGVGAMYSLHNTQVARFLSRLVDDAQAKPVGRRDVPHYRLTRLGIFSLISKITLGSYLAERNDCLLVWYFLKSYAPQIRKIIKGAGNEFSRAHALEVEQLLDIALFLKRQRGFVDQEILRLTERIRSTHGIHREISKHQSRGGTMESGIELVAKNFPYELNAERSFDELLRTIPKDVMEWELTDGARLKTELVFTPILDEMKRFREHLLRLEQESLAQG